MPSKTKTPLVTATQIAETCGVIGPRVQFILATRDIKPVHVAGSVRLYDRAAIAAVKRELAVIDAKRRKA